jgi:hypothetical protein
MRGLVLISLLLLWITPCLAAGSTDFQGRVTAVLDHQTLEGMPTHGSAVRVRLHPTVSWPLPREALAALALHREVTVSTATTLPDGTLQAFVLLANDLPLIHVLESATWDTPAAKQYQRQQAAAQREAQAPTPRPADPEATRPPPPDREDRPSTPMGPPAELLSCLSTSSAGSAPPQDPALVSEALKTLRKVQAATEVGMNMSDYSKLVVEAKAAVNDALSALSDTDLKKEIEVTMQAYADGLTVYNLALQERSDGFLVGTSSPQAQKLNDIYHFTPQPPAIISKDVALSEYIWKVASIHLQCAMDLAK